jgi:hypothetical protein
VSRGESGTAQSAVYRTAATGREARLSGLLRKALKNVKQPDGREIEEMQRRVKSNMH